MSKAKRIRNQKQRTARTRDAREAGRLIAAGLRSRLVLIDEQLINFLISRGWEESYIREAMEAGCVYYNPDRDTLSTDWQGEGLFKGL